jgi:hypothetical protein
MFIHLRWIVAGAVGPFNLMRLKHLHSELYLEYPPPQAATK